MFWYLTLLYSSLTQLKQNNLKILIYLQTKTANKPVHFVLLTFSFIIIIIICKTTETLIFNVNNNLLLGLL